MKFTQKTGFGAKLSASGQIWSLRLGQLVLLASLAWPVMSPADDTEVQALVDELQSLAEKSRQERAADRWLQNALEDLVAKYNFPWRNSLFSDDFSDGDYLNDPTWQVDSGEYWVDRRLGLRSQVRQQPRSAPAPAPERQEQDLGKALLGAFLQEALGPQGRGQSTPQPQSQSATAVPATIRTAIQIPTTFAVESVFSQNNRPGESGQLEWVVMQDANASNAYKVVITTGNRPMLDVLRVRSGQASYVQSADVPALNDGGEHILSWRQTAGGNIEVFLDGEPVIKVTDRAFRYGFKYLGLVNRGGDFAVTGVEVLGGS